MSFTFSRINATPLSALAIAALLLASTQANADSGEPAQTNQSMFGTETEVVVGLGGGVSPRYMGASAMHLQALPTLALRRGIFFADSTRGIGAEYQTASGFYIGQSFNYDFGRTDSNSFLRPGSDRLRGMGNVKGAITSTLAVAQQIAPWFTLNAQAEFGLDGHDRGNQYQFGVETSTSPTSSDILTADLVAKLGDRQYNQSYFGVTPTQSANSGFQAYTPGSGIYAYSLAGTWDHKFDKHWASQLILGTTMYTAAATNSAIVQRKFAPILYTAVNYTF